MNLFSSFFFTTLIFLCLTNIQCHSYTDWDQHFQGKYLERRHLEESTLTGISGITIDAKNRLWAIPERHRFLINLSQQPFVLHEDVGIEQSIPLFGLPKNIDTESIAYYQEDLFWLGTEGQGTPKNIDMIYLVQRNDERADVVGSIQLDYKIWHMHSKGNQGIEGLCYQDNLLLAAVEQPYLDEQNRRFAPLGRYHLPTKQWQAFLIALTSKNGTISALSCLDHDAEHLEVFAIERHFHVSRILRFLLPKKGEQKIIEPQIWFNFKPIIALTSNYEGMAWLNEKQLLMISDNSFGFVTGPTEILLIRSP